MSHTSKLIISRIGSFLLVALFVPGVVGLSLGQAPRFRGQEEFLPYTGHLPIIDKIELLKLELKDDRWDGEIAGSKILKGKPKVSPVVRKEANSFPKIFRLAFTVED
jgi:hypothetical protein